MPLGERSGACVAAGSFYDAEVAASCSCAPRRVLGRPLLVASRPTRAGVGSAAPGASRRAERCLCGCGCRSASGTVGVRLGVVFTTPRWACGGESCGRPGEARRGGQGTAGISATVPALTESGQGVSVRGRGFSPIRQAGNNVPDLCVDPVIAYWESCALALGHTTLAPP